MDGVTWAPLMEHTVGRGLIGSHQLMDGAQLDMLRVESGLLAAKLPAVFYPHRPGEWVIEASDDPIRLMVREDDLQRAREILEAVTSDAG